MNTTFEIVNREAVKSIVIRTRCSVAELPGLIGPAYQRIGQHLQALGAMPAGPPYVAYHNEDMQDLDLEIGIPVAHEVKAQGEFELSSIPDGRYASMLYTGPYRDLTKAYGQISAWIAEQALQPTGSCYEIYLNDPADTPEEALQTLILFPL